MPFVGVSKASPVEVQPSANAASSNPAMSMSDGSGFGGTLPCTWIAESSSMLLPCSLHSVGYAMRVPSSVFDTTNGSAQRLPENLLTIRSDHHLFVGTGSPLRDESMYSFLLTTPVTSRPGRSSDFGGAAAYEPPPTGTGVDAPGSGAAAAVAAGVVAVRASAAIAATTTRAVARWRGREEGRIMALSWNVR